MSALSKRIYYSKAQISRVEQGLRSPTMLFATNCDQAFNTDGELARAAAELVSHEPSTDGEPAFDLPAGPDRLIGRDLVVEDLTSYLRTTADRRAARVWVLHGMPGAGKTAIALWVAESLYEEFVDGCLYIDMQGYTMDSHPVSSDEALDRLLRRLGVDGEAVPPELAERAALLRKRLANRRVLIILDNVSDSEQAVHLLPPNGPAAMIIMSRRSLTGLGNVPHRQVGALLLEDAVELFHWVAQLPTGSVDRGDPAIVAEIARMCFGLPLALCIVASRFRDNPARRLEDVAARLADQNVRGREFEDDLRSVAAAFAASCATLADTQQAMLALLALHPGPHFDVASAAALAGANHDAAADVLDNLIRAGMLEWHSHDAYRLHGLLREYLRQPLPSALSQAEADAGRRRLHDFYLHTAAAADLRIDSHRFRVNLEPSATGVAVTDFPDRATAIGWMTREADNFVPLILDTTEHGEHSKCWQFAYYLRGFFYTTKQWELMIACFDEALVSARRTGEHQAIAIMLNNLGLANTQLRRNDEAIRCYRDAQQEFAAANDPYGEANVVNNDAWRAYEAGDYREALDLARTAWQFYRDREMYSNATIALDCVARCEARLGELRDAEKHFRQVLTDYTELSFSDGDTAQLLSFLAETQLRLGKAPEAEQHFQRAIVQASRAKATREVAVAFEGLSKAAAAQCRLIDAERHRASALELFDEMGSVEDVDRLRAQTSVGPGGRGPALVSGTRRGRLQVLAVSTEWSSKHGGLSTFNRRLCVALAARGAQVYCSVPSATEAEHRMAEAAGVHLVHPPPALSGREPESALSRPPKTTTPLRPDVVFGHGRVTGELASWLVEDHYRDARLITFLHVMPERLEFEKDQGADGDPMRLADSRSRDELAIARKAALSVGVGPVLYNYLHDRLHGSGAPQPFRLDPGFDPIGSPATPPPSSDTVRVLLVGRLNTREARVKGIDVAARALGSVMRSRGADEPTVELVLRGVADGEGRELVDAVRRWAGSPSLRVVPRPYSPDEITLQQDLQQASVVIMPSRAEGFGLVGMEAIAMGVPTIVSKSSGLGALLTELRDQLSVELANKVIPVTEDEQVDTLRWSDVVASALSNTKPSFAAATTLRDDMASIRSWDRAAAELMTAIQALTGLEA
jgi:glycosyltransferase involved in cell wall biosynthesis/tetratricopeptide (TPR) repeat protein